MLTRIHFCTDTLDKLHAALVDYETRTAQEEERRLRDRHRRDILAAITTIEDRLERLEEITRPRCRWLTALRNEIAADFED